ncbi:hypothetical protein DPMN_182737 [Dreissena polymorpha]|uniref:Uncharacterized protein n=1 Tax=Dreissena polymorpha TaxID=45954 RepID=A0A9D4I4Y1_DREPO|nr:hypothetical protein DPMN_182737 [Dreissena polymorpha]
MTDSLDKCCGDSDEQRCCDYLEYTAESRYVPWYSRAFSSHHCEGEFAPCIM